MAKSSTTTHTTAPVLRGKTGIDVAKIAGALLNGSSIKESEAWLNALIDDPETSDADVVHATNLLGVLTQVRRLAASALSQRQMN